MQANYIGYLSLEGVLIVKGVLTQNFEGEITREIICVDTHRSSAKYQRQIQPRTH